MHYIALRGGGIPPLYTLKPATLGQKLATLRLKPTAQQLKGAT